MSEENVSDELDRLQERAAQLDEEAARLGDFLSWRRDKLFPNSHVGATDKIILAVLYLMLWEAGRELVSIPMRQLAAKTGLSSQTVSERLRSLAALGVLRRDAQVITESSGLRRIQVLIGTTDLFYTPDMIRPLKKQGGQRVKRSLSQPR